MAKKFKKIKWEKFDEVGKWNNILPRIQKIAKKSLNKYCHKNGSSYVGMKTYKGPERIQDCKRICGSLIHNAIMGLGLKKSRGGEGRECFVRDGFKKAHGLNKKNFMEEVIVVRKRYPLFSGVLDGLLKTSGGYIVIEFKGFFNKRIIYSPKTSFKAQHPAIKQLLFYLFLLNWPDGILVYGFINHNKVELIKTIKIVAGESEMLQKEIEGFSKNEFLEIFCKEIFVWKLFKFTHVHVKHSLHEFVKKELGWLMEMVKDFSGAKKKNKRNPKKPKWPKLNEFKIPFITSFVL